MYKERKELKREIGRERDRQNRAFPWLYATRFHKSLCDNYRRLLNTFNKWWKK